MSDGLVTLWQLLAEDAAAVLAAPRWLVTGVAIVTAGMLLETLLLLAWHRRTGGGLPPRSLLPTLVAGGGLMGALLALLAGAPLGFLLALLSLSGISHVLDMRRRWQPRSRHG